MTDPQPTGPSALTEAERLEALSRRYAPDSIRIRLLESGRWAVFDADNSLLGAATTLEGVSALTAHLTRAAEVGRANLAAELAANVRRAAEAREIAELDLSDLELEIE